MHTKYFPMEIPSLFVTNAYGTLRISHQKTGYDRVDMVILKPNLVKS